MKKMLFAVILLIAGYGLSAQITVQPPVDTATKAVVDSAGLYGFIPQRPVKVGGGPAK